jgi:hypothetical protein
VDPGHRVIVATAGGAEQMAEADLAEGASQTVELHFAAPGTAAPAFPASAAEPTSEPTREAPSDGSTQRILGLVTGGVGVVALGVGGYFTLRALSKKSDSNADGRCNGNDCDAIGLGLRDDAVQAGNVATVASIVGLVALGGGAVLYLTAPSSNGGAESAGVTLSPEVTLGGGFVTANGRF